MAPTLLEHDYIGLSGTQQPPPPPPEDGNGDDGDLGGLLTGTDLRLGLPGSDRKLLLQLLPQRKDSVSVPVLTLAPPKGASGAKRGFSDAIAGSDNRINGVGNGVAKDGQTALGSATAGANMENKGQAAALAEDVAAGGTDRGIAPAAKAQVVGWPPIRSYRKNTMAANPSKNNDDDAEEKQDSSCLYVKVSMDGAPYLRKVDLKLYTNYKELSTALDKMFSCFTAGQCGSHGAQGKDGHKDSRQSDLRGSDLVVTYEDKDGDWMLVGDVPWDMFTDSCRRLRIMKGSDAIGLAPRAMDKCKNKN